MHFTSSHLSLIPLLLVDLFEMFFVEVVNILIDSAFSRRVTFLFLMLSLLFGAVFIGANATDCNFSSSKEK